MQSRNWMRTALGAAVGAYAIALPAQATFLDIFEDGDPQDHQPVYWQPIADNGTFEVVAGDYILTPNNADEQISARGEPHLIGPVRITTQVRLTGAAEYAGMWARGEPNPNTLWAAVINDGSLLVGRGGNNTLETVPLGFDPTVQDLMLEFQISDDSRLVGRPPREHTEYFNHLMARVWPEGEDRPEVPVIAFDTLLGEHNAIPGSIGLFTRSTSGGNGSAIFRWVEALSLGDMDGNDVLDAFDVDDFEVALADDVAFAASHPEIDPHIMGDLNGDGACDAFDIKPFELGLALGGGSASAAAMVPEPATLALLGLGGLMLLRKRR